MATGCWTGVIETGLLHVCVCVCVSVNIIIFLLTGLLTGLDCRLTRPSLAECDSAVSIS
jgi:hypothetical protein